MKSGNDEGLADKLARMGLNDSSRPLDKDTKKNSFFQVVKAVEAAEFTIKQQVEENYRLRDELQKKLLELEKSKLDESMPQRPNLADQSNASIQGFFEAHQSAADGRLDDRVKSTGNASIVNPSGSLFVHQHLLSHGEDAASHTHARSQSEGSMIDGSLRRLSQFSSPSTPSLSPMRHRMDGESDPHFNLSTHGLMPVDEVYNSSRQWKQGLVHKIREQEEEIFQLRKHLASYSVKEAQIQSEKHVLEHRIAYMRLAFDQQQQDLIDAASKALSYRQEILEENIRLSYAFQAAQQERATFVSSLLPLLAEYSLQPQVSEAQSIVGSMKVLFRHLQENLLLTESKLKESEYQLTPWRSDVHHNEIAPMSSTHSVGTGLTTSEKSAHELESDEPGRYSSLSRRNVAAHEMPEQLGVTQDEAHAATHGEANKKVTFHEPLSKTEMDDMDAKREPYTREPSYAATFDDSSSSKSLCLQPVLEESSSFEVADDDPLPAVEGLQISGEAFPGKELQASGYSINGTTSCNFEWVRHLEDGSVNYIDGAKQPNYLVTADDIDTYLAIEVQPLDDRKRKGELVRVFANEQQKIACDPEMQNHIENTLYSGHASYNVSFETGYLNIWEPSTLSIKREGYSIKRSSGVVITEKFSPSTAVTIPSGQPAEFVITGSHGTKHLLRGDIVATDVSCSRDTIVLTLRLFIIRAIERRTGKGKKKGFLFIK